ncbi:MAG: A/G-specific adenine glycosylase [Peptostreptococcaceae bacterium]|nr:A/G-specific adenine glycosylase [Peptostreptococcaceae bacterium]
MNKNLKKLSAKVLSHYKKNRRILPWREDPTPYHVWISEIMLQQTRVDTVIPYFERFVQTFPTIRALAEGDEDTLLKLWEGLGYYSRARNIHKAAKLIVDKHQGEMPGSKEELLRLPGIGPYTAGAIASIAFGKKETAVDGNLIRVGTRLLAYDRSVVNAEGKRDLENFWASLLPEKNAGDFNQAIMDIGATICLPNGDPLCLICPINEFCTAFELGLQTDFPKKEVKKPRRVEKKTILLLFCEDKILLEKREDQGLLRGMWQFPMIDGHLSEDEARDHLQKNGLSAIRIHQGPRAKHIFSHIEWHMIAWEVRLDPFALLSVSTSDTEVPTTDSRKDQPTPLSLNGQKKRSVKDPSETNSDEYQTKPDDRSEVQENSIQYTADAISQKSSDEIKMPDQTWIETDRLDQITLPTAFRIYRQRATELR